MNCTLFSIRWFALSLIALWFEYDGRIRFLIDDHYCTPVTLRHHSVTIISTPLSPQSFPLKCFQLSWHEKVRKQQQQQQQQRLQSQSQFNSIQYQSQYQYQFQYQFQYQYQYQYQFQYQFQFNRIVLIKFIVLIITFCKLFVLLLCCVCCVVCWLVWSLKIQIVSSKLNSH